MMHCKMYDGLSRAVNKYLYKFSVQNPALCSYNTSINEISREYKKKYNDYRSNDKRFNT